MLILGGDMHSHERLLVFILWHLSRSYKALAFACVHGTFIWTQMKEMYWKRTIPCITRDRQLLSDILNVKLVTIKIYRNKYSLVELWREVNSRERQTRERESVERFPDGGDRLRSE